jgi:PKD repeat protein
VVDLNGIPENVIFYNNSTNSVRAEWLIDGTKSSNFDSVLYTFDKNGYYPIFLTVYNKFDCPDTTTIVFRAVMKGVEMPNAFEPENTNSDLNSFKPKAIGLQTYFLGVWDLWGNLVWSTDKLEDTTPAKPDGEWNGTDSKGNKMPAQNYIWRMKATFIDGTVWKGVKDRFGKFHSEGTFTLLR